MMPRLENALLDQPAAAQEFQQPRRFFRIRNLESVESKFLDDAPVERFSAP